MILQSSSSSSTLLHSDKSNFLFPLTARLFFRLSFRSTSVSSPSESVTALYSNRNSLILFSYLNFFFGSLWSASSIDDGDTSRSNAFLTLLKLLFFVQSFSHLYM